MPPRRAFCRTTPDPEPGGDERQRPQETEAGGRTRRTLEPGCERQELCDVTLNRIDSG